MVRYKAILAYDGTDFAGFQRQARARTVQGEIEAALRHLNWTRRSILAAGRTDAGVHAVGQVIAFDLDWAHSPEDLLNALNARLPADVAVQHVQQVQEDFHPRFQALARRYRYTLFCHPVRHPLRERFAWRVWPELDVDLLRRAAEPLIGTHDFRAFGVPPRAGGSTVRQVFRASWARDAQAGYLFDVEANAFLFHMVRRMVRLQVEVALGKLPVEQIPRYLAGEFSEPVMGLAPPQGLCLLEVRYPHQGS